MSKKCKVDGCNREVCKGRRYCRHHYLELKRKQFHERVESGTYRRTMYDKECILCGKSYKAWRKDSKFCSHKCSVASLKNEGINNYVYSGDYKVSIWEHRVIASKILGRKLNSNEVVHHVDLNPKNNSLSNLIVLSRNKHASLHRYIGMQGALLKRLGNVNIENCWETWIHETTTTWLETAGVKVIKLSDARQSAAELRTGEGSETMHDAPQVGDDIVQTTTANAGHSDMK